MCGWSIARNLDLNPVLAQNARRVPVTSVLLQSTSTHLAPEIPGRHEFTNLSAPMLSALFGISSSMLIKPTYSALSLSDDVCDHPVINPQDTLYTCSPCAPARRHAQQHCSVRLRPPLSVNSGGRRVDHGSLQGAAPKRLARPPWAPHVVQAPPR